MAELDMRELLEENIVSAEEVLKTLSPDSKEAKAVTDNLDTMYKIRLKEYELDNEATANNDKSVTQVKELELKQRELDLRERELEAQLKRDKSEKILKSIEAGAKATGTLACIGFGAYAIKMEYFDGMAPGSGFLRTLFTKLPGKLV